MKTYLTKKHLIVIPIIIVWMILVSLTKDTFHFKAVDEILDVLSVMVGFFIGRLFWNWSNE